MLWNLILKASEPATETMAPEVVVEERIETKRVRRHKVRRCSQAHRVRNLLTKETDAITHALNAGQMPLIPSEGRASKECR